MFQILCNSRYVSVVDVTNLEQNLQEKITLNSLQYTAVQINFEFKVGTIFGCFKISYMLIRTFYIDIHHVHISPPKMVSFVRL